MHTEWNASGTEPITAYAIEVARRQSDGTWRWLIGDPTPSAEILARWTKTANVRITGNHVTTRKITSHRVIEKQLDDCRFREHPSE